MSDVSSILSDIGGAASFIKSPAPCTFWDVTLSLSKFCDREVITFNGKPTPMGAPVGIGSEVIVFVAALIAVPVISSVCPVLPKVLKIAFTPVSTPLTIEI